MKENQSLAHIRWDCKCHVAFIPKKREKRIFGVLRQHFGAIFRELAKRKEVEVVEGHLMSDWPVPNSMDTKLSKQSLFLKVNRADISQRRMPSNRIVKNVDIISCRPWKTPKSRECELLFMPEGNLSQQEAQNRESNMGEQKRQLAQYLAQIVTGPTEQRIDCVPLFTFEEVSPQSPVVLHMADHRFNCISALKLLFDGGREPRLAPAIQTVVSSTPCPL